MIEMLSFMLAWLIMLGLFGLAVALLLALLILPPILILRRHRVPR